MSHLPELERQYLEAVLHWLDTRLDRLVRQWQLAGQDSEDRFRGLYISGDEAQAIAGRKAGTHWGTGVQLPDIQISELDQKEKDARQMISQIEEQADEAGNVLRLQSLRKNFNLSEFEWWVFIVTMAPSLDLRYEKLFSYLQDDVTRKFANVDLCLNLLSDPGLDRLDDLKFFDPFAPLRKFKLIQMVEDQSQPAGLLRQAFSAAPTVVNWILDDYRGSEQSGSKRVSFPFNPDQQEESQFVFNEDKIPPPSVLENVGPFLCLFGKDNLQQEMTARQISTAMGRALLKIWLPDNPDGESLLDSLAYAIRDAKMLDAWLLIQQSEIMIDQYGYLLPFCFEALQAREDIIFFSSKVPFRFNPVYPNSDYPLINIAFADLTTSERREIWVSLLEDFANDLPSQDLTTLAGQFTLTSGQILAASSTAISQALQYNRPLTSGDLFRAAQFHSGHYLDELAQKIEPRYTWEDIILSETPMNMLREMVQMVKDRPLVLEGWQLGKKLAASNGISALFSGPPGTGKTLSAQIIANELGIDLYRIDLSTVVSKYVGETEKNLEKIFSEASESNAILFFDEADTIFGKRSEVKDAQDRYANLEVGYLLQRMESYNGLAILATNLKANLDEAFTRRLQFIINFPFPEEEYRFRIWKVLIPPTMPLDENVDLALMAKRFKLAGGNIRNIILSAAYYAAENGQQVNMEHLMHGARRELQKMGKLVQESDFVLD